MALIRILKPSACFADLRGAGHLLYCLHRHRDAFPCKRERTALVADRDQILSCAGRHRIVIDLQDIIRLDEFFRAAGVGGKKIIL